MVKIRSLTQKEIEKKYIIPGGFLDIWNGKMAHPYMRKTLAKIINLARRSNINFKLYETENGKLNLQKLTKDGKVIPRVSIMERLLKPKTNDADLNIQKKQIKVEYKKKQVKKQTNYKYKIKVEQLKHILRTYKEQHKINYSKLTRDKLIELVQKLNLQHHINEFEEYNKKQLNDKNQKKQIKKKEKSVTSQINTVNDDLEDEWIDGMPEDLKETAEDSSESKYFKINNIFFNNIKKIMNGSKSVDDIVQLYHTEGKKKEGQLFYNLQGSKNINFFATDRICLKNVLNKIKLFIKSNQPKKINILDPSIGTGNLIMPLLKNNFISRHIQYIDGIEYLTNMYEIVNNIFIDPNIHIINDNFLTRDFKNNKYDIIICNPPFSIMTDDSKGKYKEDKLGYIYFIQKSISLLKKNGIAFFITPIMDIEILNKKNNISPSSYYEKYGEFKFKFNLKNQLNYTFTLIDLCNSFKAMHGNKGQNKNIQTGVYMFENN